MKRIIIFLVVLGILLTFSISLVNTAKNGGDFLAYWSSSYLFVHSGNPYNQEELSTLERTINPTRFSEGIATMSTWNPPWLIFFLLPFGFLPFNLAFTLWIFCNVLLIGLAVLLTWRICQGPIPSRGFLVVVIVVFLYAETIAYLAIGQITSIVLLSIILFIYLTQRGLDWPAGVALLMTTIKPHVTYLFLVLVLIWIFKNHRWKVIFGSVSAALLSMIVFWLVIPNWISDYLYLLTHLPYTQLYMSTIGNFFSSKYNTTIFNYSAIILLFFIQPLFQIIKKEGLLTGVNLALLISIPISPYGFSFDHIVLIPVLVQIIAWYINHELSNKMIGVLGLGFLLLNILVAKMISIDGLEYYWFFWIPIAFLVLYLIGRRNKNAAQQLPA